MFSRNSASSRAIPVEKQIDRVLNDIAFPIEFGTNQKGMQAGPPLRDDALSGAKDAWVDASRKAVEYARLLEEMGVHKQVTNRLLEPFMWHTVIISSGSGGLANFFRQRCSPLAQPEIRVAAEAIEQAFEASTPSPVEYNAWHTPYIQDDEQEWEPEKKVQVSAARCARVSYLTQNGIRDPQEDLDLYERLITADPPHWSPLEHVATPSAIGHEPLGNFPRWHQLRHNVRLFATINS